MGELMAEEGRYRSALDAINERSQLHRQEIQPLLEREGIVRGGNYSFARIENVLGNRLYITMQQATEQVIDHIDSTVISLEQIADKLVTSLKKQYPKKTIISFKMPS